jgi:hypothetical protein
MNNALDDIIILRTVYGKVGQKIFINPMKDPKTGRYPDCVRRVDSKGDMIMSEDDKNNLQTRPLIPEDKVFTIEDGTTLNLQDPYQKAEWEAIQFCPLIALARDARDKKGNLLIDGEVAEGKIHARYGVAEFYIERPGYETNKKVSKKKQIHTAVTYILEDPLGDEGRKLKARVLGKDMSSAPSADVEDYLIEIAEKDPKKIVNLYTGGDMALRLLLLDAKEKRVIRVKNKLYIYGDDIVLGATDDAAVSWLQDPVNHKIVDLIKKDTHPEFYTEGKKPKEPAPARTVTGNDK